MISFALPAWIQYSPYLVYLENKYILAILILLATAIGAKLLLFIFEKVFLNFAKKTKTDIDDLIVEKIKSPLFYLILAFGLKLVVGNLQINGVVTKIASSVMALVFIFLLARVVDIVIEVWGRTFSKKTKSKIDDVLLPLFHKMVKVVFVIIGTLWVLNIWGIDIAPYLAGAGIIGLVLGFALQDSLKNVLGGVTLLLDKTFQIGDKVKLEDGTVGMIHDIGLRSTKVITFDNEVVYVPNGYLANSRIQNFTRPNPKVRTNVLFGVEYGSDPEKVKKIVLNAMKNVKGILKEPKSAVQFTEMGDSALQFKALFWVDHWDESYSTKLEVTQLIYDALNKAKIGIPFPTQTVYLKKD